MPKYLHYFSAGLCEAFKSRCEGCTEEKKNQIKNFFLHIKNNRSDDWQKIVDKYDPKGDRREIWKEILA